MIEQAIWVALLSAFLALVLVKTGHKAWVGVLIPPFISADLYFYFQIPHAFGSDKYFPLAYGILWASSAASSIVAVLLWLAVARTINRIAGH